MIPKILVVFEGKVAEPKLFDFIRTKHLNSTPIIYTVFGTVIYKLWADLEKDEYLSAFEVIKESSDENRITLAELNRDDVSEIYLFFDHDGHVSNACNDKLSNMLYFFNDEFEQGKLFINYPMVESIIDICSNQCYSSKVHPIKSNKEYKKIVHKRSKFKRLNEITEKEWKEIINANCSKANFLINKQFSFPENLINQSDIFNVQKEFYIDTNNCVSVLSGFILFLYDYLGQDGLRAFLR